MRPPRPRPIALLIAAAGVFALASCGSDKTLAPEPEPDPVTPVDSVAPTIIWFSQPYEQVGPLERIRMTFRAIDAFGIKRLALNLSGAAVDSSGWFELEAPVTDFEGWFEFTVPYVDDINKPLMVTLIVADEAGLTAQNTVSLSLRDRSPPQAAFEFKGLRDDETVGTGESFDLRVDAADNYRLSFIGYEGGGRRDSVPVTGDLASHTFRLTVPPSWRADRPLFRAWARDSLGQSGESSQRMVPVYDWTPRPVVTMPLLNIGDPLSFTYDAGRSVAYYLRYNADGQATWLDVMHVPSGVLDVPIHLTEAPHAMKLTPSGDSLLMTFTGTRSLGVIDLRQPERTVNVTPLPQPDSTIRAPLDLQVSGRHLFVVLGGTLYNGRLLDIDLLTGTKEFRTDLDGAPDISRDPSLLRLPDGRMYISPDPWNYDEGNRFLYSPASDGFIRTFRLRTSREPQYSPSTSGRFMLGNVVYDAALNVVDSVAANDWIEGEAALSPDGQSVYLSATYGYLKVRLSDGAILDQVKLGMVPKILIVTPDANRLLVIGERPGGIGFQVMFVDLR